MGKVLATSQGSQSVAPPLYQNLAMQTQYKGNPQTQNPVTSSVHQGSILGPMLLNSFIIDPENRMAFTFSKFADDIKPGGVTDIPSGCTAIQMNGLETWTDSNLMKFSKIKHSFPQGNTCGGVSSCTSKCFLLTIWKAALSKKDLRHQKAPS